MHTMITAHSGCEGRPDNSLEYVQYALHCGADALKWMYILRMTAFTSAMIHPMAHILI